MRAAVQAVMAGLAMDAEAETDVLSGTLRVPLMQHQRMALAWMLKREAAQPAGKHAHHHLQSACVC